MKTRAVPALIGAALLLAACASAPAPQLARLPTATAVVEVPAGRDPFAPSSGQLTQMDTQGAIAVQITPLNLGVKAAQLEFEVALNTHSVDLSMDLAPLATLATDSGAVIGASLWDAPRGGHHVTGKLIFAGSTDDGQAILEGATRVTLTITGLDVPTRSFEWDLE